MHQKNIRIALAGNPNSGKTTIFNALTGTHQHVGNYPGVTIERKEGHFKHKGYDIHVIDLPGTYSLTVYSPDEVIARNVIVNEQLDLVVNVVDASNLWRNLYLTAQIMELGVPMLLAANMSDMVEAYGLEIDYSLLSQLLGMPVVPVVGTQNKGIKELLDQVIVSAVERRQQEERRVNYTPEVESEVKRLEALIAGLKTSMPENAATAELISHYPERWLALKLLENDKELLQKLQNYPATAKILQQARKSQDYIRSMLGSDPELIITDGRYAFARGAYQEAVIERSSDQATITEKLDEVLLNRYLGLPIFLGIMWLLFQLTFTLGGPPMDWIDAGFSTLGGWLGNLIPEGVINSLLVEGVIGGVGGVLTFLPNILLLFLGIAFLEGTGYMARAAFVMDKIMHRVGLHGKSFVPMLTGFGCSIPALMATRILENEKDRLITMMVAPLISCGARLPVYTLLIGAFFAPQVAGNVLFSIYLVGIALALIMAKVFRTWLLPGESEPFVMELPAYRLPTLKALMLHMWERVWLYLRKAGTIILAASLLMWTLFNLPMADENGPVKLEQTYAGQIGKAIESVMTPLGLDWRTGIALIAGITAKEVVISTLGTLYSIEDGEALAEEEKETVMTFAERARQYSGLTPFKAYVLMIFVLLYVPCMAAIAVLKRETNSWKWTLFTISYTLVLAWTVSFLIYRGGLLLGLV